MIPRKLKVCKTCQSDQYIWSHGNCQSCDAKLRLTRNSGTKSKVTTQSDKKMTAKALKPLEDKSVPELLKLATIIFNKWVRNKFTVRNEYFFCISCGQEKKPHEMQSGHFMPSTYSSLRFCEINVWPECETCNCHDPNHLIGYRKNLIDLIGLDAVLELEATPIAKYHKWDREELLDIIKKYKPSKAS